MVGWMTATHITPPPPLGVPHFSETLEEGRAGVVVNQVNQAMWLRCPLCR